MNQNKIVNVYFLSLEKKSGISSLIHRMLYNDFNEKILESNKKNQYQYNILIDGKVITFNFWNYHQEKEKLISSLDNKNQNIILFVYNVDKDIKIDDFKGIIRQINKNQIKNVKFGLVGNKLDLVKDLDISVKSGGEFAKKINKDFGKFILISAKEGKGNLLQFIIEILNSELIKSKKTLMENYKKIKPSSDIHRCKICKTKILIAKFHDNLNRIEYNCKENHNHNYFSLYEDEINNKEGEKKTCEESNSKCKNNESPNFCKICKKLICSNCSNQHKHETGQDLISPYYGEDRLCEMNGKKYSLH